MTAGAGSPNPAAFRCSTLSSELGEPLAGTASTVRNWLLVEQPGAWGPRVLLESRLPGEVASHLRVLARDLGLRVLLIRRADRPLIGSGPVGRNVFLVHSGPDAPWMEHVRLEAAGDILGLDLDPLGAGRPPGVGAPVAGPLYTVCTNGRRDPCCAERGRPLAAALGSWSRDRTWECSHIGGDRFAATLVAFPHGLYFGRVRPDRGLAIARAYGAGRIELDAYRGRSSHPVQAQAAEIHLRRAHGLDGVDDLRLVGVDQRGNGPVVVRFETGEERTLTASVRVSFADPARPFTCHGRRPSNPLAFEVEEREAISPG